VSTDPAPDNALPHPSSLDQPPSYRAPKYRKNKAPFHAVPPARGASAPLPPAGAAAARGGSGWGGSGTTARAGLIQRDERRCKLVQKLDERRCKLVQKLDCLPS
jgi:hypothetical protein